MHINTQIQYFVLHNFMFHLDDFTKENTSIRHQIPYPAWRRRRPARPFDA
eukprot:SAG11_NODE_13_length_26388_cov_67.360341_19_plen_50_part_00